MSPPGDPSATTARTPLQRMLAARRAFERVDAEVDGRRVVARRSVVAPRSHAPSLVLIGGTALSGRYLLPVAVELAARYPVWVPDLPGRGASEAPERTLDVAGHADHLVTWMRCIGLERAVILGNSMGCQIAVEAAVRHPERVSHVVLQGPTTDPRARSMLRQAARLLAVGRHEPPSLAPIEAVDWLRTRPWRAFASSRAAIHHPVEERLPRVRCPALVVRGAADAVVPQRWAREVVRLLPEAELREVPGAGHAMVYATALELARVVDAFLQRTG